MAFKLNTFLFSLSFDTNLTLYNIFMQSPVQILSPAELIHVLMSQVILTRKQ